MLWAWCNNNTHTYQYALLSTSSLIRSDYSPGGRANKTYLRGCKSESTLLPYPPNQNVKKVLQRQRRLGLAGCVAEMALTCTTALDSTYHCGVNKCYLHGCRVNCPLAIRLPVEQELIYAVTRYISTCYKPYSPGRRLFSFSFYCLLQNNSLHSQTTFRCG